MKRILIVLVCIVFSFAGISQTTDWVKSFGGDASDKGISIGTDSLGFIYGSGFFNNEATFGGITLTNSPLSSWGNNKENFVFKMDSLGNVLWAVAGGDLSGSCCDDRALGMHVTPGGDVFITGTFWSSYYIGSCQVTQNQWGTALNSSDNSLLAKLDTDGNCVWVIGFGADQGGSSSAPCPAGVYSRDDHSYDVKVDSDGFIYVTGFFSGVSADFDNLSITNPHWDSDCQPMGYVGKLDSNGNWLWVHSFDGVKDQRGSRDNRLAIDQFSNIYVVGGFQNTGNYGPFNITSNGEWDAFIFKMDKDGNWIWAEGFGSNKTDRANGIAIDVCDDIYVTGEYRNPMVFPGANASNGSDTLSHKQKRDIFVAKINNQGDWKWAKRARSEGTDKPYQMSVDANKQVFVGGTARGEMTFSNGLVVGPQIPGDTTASAWVAQLDGSSNTGDWVWAKTAGTDTDDDDRTGDICPDRFGNVYAIGFFEDLADFDGTILDATGRRKDVFVWKMSTTPKPPFTYNNTYDTVLTDSMVFNPIDTGIFTTSGFVVDGCDTSFVDSVVHQRLGRRIVFTVNDLSTLTTIIVDGGVLPILPMSIDYYIDDTVNISSVVDPLYGFTSWSSNSTAFLASSVSQNAFFFVVNSDTITLNIYQKPTIVYNIDPPGTSTTIDVNGVNVSVFPYSENVFIDALNTINPNIDPSYGFGSWTTNYNTLLNGSNSINNSFYGVYTDTITLKLDSIMAYMSGNDTICDNEEEAEIKIYFTGTPPFTFSYSVNGNIQSDSSTYDNPYIIRTKTEGIYELVSYQDANNSGEFDGSGLVTILENPNAIIHLESDTLSILHPTLSYVSQSTPVASIESLEWDFGDNSYSQFASGFHEYNDSVASYTITLSVANNLGCSDTVIKNVWIGDDYWIYIPNAFTPDNDNHNDKFCIEYNAIKESNFIFNVFDRFSNLVYSTNNIVELSCENGWDGTHYKTGNDLPMGTYIYEVYFEDNGFERWKHQERGHLIIVR